MAAIYEIPIGRTDRIEVDWSDWLAELPAGQAIDSIAHVFDGGDGGMVLTNSTFLGAVSIVNVNAAAATVGLYYLKISPTSNASPDNFVNPGWLQIRVVEKVFLEQDDS
jgi:hypothetical protein